MGELVGIYAVWLREMKVFLREPERVVSSLVSPLLWIFGFGTGLGASVTIGDVSYQTFILPGVMAMNILFTAVFYGLYIIWDRKLDFLKEVLVSPLSRSGVFAGKVLGGVTDALIQASVLYAVAAFLGLPITPFSIGVSLLALILIAVCMTSVGLFFGAILSTPESFQLVMNFVIWPLFFFSGALFPLKGLPAWLAALIYLDPLTYGVDALHWAFLSSGGVLPLPVDFAALSLACLAALALGSRAFGRMSLA